MERIHYNWRSQLNLEAERGNAKARKIIREGQSPGKYFDGKTHLFDLIKVMRQLKTDPGVKAIGIFGSRLKQNHEPLRSDIDIFVINDTPNGYEWSPSRGPTWTRETHRHEGIGQGINIQEVNTENWNKVASDPNSVNSQTYEVCKSARWLWVKSGYNPPVIK